MQLHGFLASDRDFAQLSGMLELAVAPAFVPVQEPPIAGKQFEYFAYLHRDAAIVERDAATAAVPVRPSL
jgi:hypothetical protein